MTSGFEDRLERELLDAARRRATAGAGARRRPRIALTAAVACAVLAVIAAVAAFVVALPSADHPQPAAEPPPLSPACARLQRDGRARFTDAPVDRRLLAAFAVLRRPQTAADRRECPAFIGSLVNPRASRLARSNPDGQPIYLVPVAKRLQGGPGPRDAGPELCIFTVFAGGAGGGSCGALGPYLRGVTGASSVGRIAVGLQPDGVATLELVLRDGTRQRIALVNNVWSYRMVTRARAAANPVVRVITRAADGTIVRSFRGGIARGFDARASAVARRP